MRHATAVSLTHSPAFQKKCDDSGRKSDLLLAHLLVEHLSTEPHFGAFACVLGFASSVAHRERMARGPSRQSEIFLWKGKKRYVRLYLLTSSSGLSLSSYWIIGTDASSVLVFISHPLLCISGVHAFGNEAIDTECRNRVGAALSLDAKNNRSFFGPVSVILE